MGFGVREKDAGSHLCGDVLQVDNLVRVSYHHGISMSSSCAGIPTSTRAQFLACNNPQEMVVHLFSSPSYVVLVKFHLTRKITVGGRSDEASRGAQRETETCSLMREWEGFFAVYYG